MILEHARGLWLFGVLAGSLTLSSVGCGGKKEQAETASDVVQGQREEDRSRCEFKGRQDRDVQESSSPGSVVANVRRVYGYIGSGDDRRRILLCREVDTNLDGIKDVVRTYGDQGEKLHEQADTDYDGTIDTWITFASGRPIKLELDKDGDGNPEEVKFYVEGKVSRVQRDTNGDGKPDIYEVYRDGTLERMGIDVDHDGQVDRWDRDAIRLRQEAESSAEQEEAAAEAQEAPSGSADDGS